LVVNIETFDFASLSLERLRDRRSAKWSCYPPDVLPAWVAEMDFPLAPAVKQALSAAIERDDCGYAWPAGVAAAFVRFAIARNRDDTLISDTAPATPAHAQATRCHHLSDHVAI